MALNREFRWIPVELYQQLRQAESDASGLFASRLSPARAERTR